MKLFWLTMLSLLAGTIFFNWLFTLTAATDGAVELITVAFEAA